MTTYKIIQKKKKTEISKRYTFRYNEYYVYLMLLKESDCN